MVTKTAESVEADETSGEKVSAKEKAMIDRIEKSERLIKSLRQKIRDKTSNWICSILISWWN